MTTVNRIMSEASQAVEDAADRLPQRSFLSPADIPADRKAVIRELSRLVASGRLMRARRGLYWKGIQTRQGMSRPTALAVALEVAGPGAGTSGFSAANDLGLTTQCPAMHVVAVPGRAPSQVPGVVFVSRPSSRAELPLSRTEATLLELLRDGIRFTEGGISKVITTARVLTAQCHVRPDVLLGQALRERPAFPKRILLEIRP